jgi:hypothetical protein
MADGDSLALLLDPIVLLLEVRRPGDMARLFFREQRHIVLELLDRELRIGRLLLLSLDHLIQFAQFRVEPRQRRALFLQPTFCLTVLRLQDCVKAGGRRSDGHAPRSLPLWLRAT